MTALVAASDLHVEYPENREVVARLRPRSPGDWLLVAGDVATRMADFEWAIETLAERFTTVVWTPGNHELSTHRADEVQLRGVARYQHLVEICRRFGVLTPEDPYPTWQGDGGPVTVAPLFLLYDYTFRIDGFSSKEASLANAHEAGVVCTDEYLLHPDPFPTREAWCRARVAETAQRLSACDPEAPLAMVAHWPLVREPTRVLRHPEFAQWCGTELTADWHRRHPTAVAVYGHLHIPRRAHYEGVPFEEVSLGYPREWSARAGGPNVPRQILPHPA
jgi:3',5'-cyclic AMP phosphodiesterase CpdA